MGTKDKRCAGSAPPSPLPCGGKIRPLPKKGKRPRVRRCGECRYPARGGKLYRHLPQIARATPAPRATKCPNNVSLRRQRLGRIFCGPCTAIMAKASAEVDAAAEYARRRA